MASKAEQVAAIVSELESENEGLRKHVEYLRGVIANGMQAVMAPGANVMIPLPPPKNIAFGQRWALVFTIGPNYPNKPTRNDLYCPLEQADGQTRSYLPIHDMPFDHEDLPIYGFYLGTVAPSDKER